ncbi:carbohydrate kinase family protein [Kamptonema cortianum]|nr:carbohydrate kinase family protein [Kamptonema cortianum]
MTDKLDVVVTGHLCLDLIPEMDHVLLNELPTPGRLFEVGPMSVSTGGAVSNTGLALHTLGARVRFLANVGDDHISNLIIEYISQYSPDLVPGIRRVSGVPSSYTIVLSPERRDRIFLHCTGTNATFGLDDIDFNLVAQGKIFHFGYPPILPRMYQDGGHELREIFLRAKRAGAVTSLDMSLPDASGPAGKADWRSVLEGVLPNVDIFVPSIDEIIFCLYRDRFNAWKGRCAEQISFADLDAAADELLAMGPAVVGFKLGEYGIYLAAADRARLSGLSDNLILESWALKRVWHPAFAVEVAGTTGAGDSAYAGLMVAMLRGDSIDDAARFACGAGACNVERPDATSGIRSASEILVRIASGWEVRNLRPK